MTRMIGIGQGLLRSPAGKLAVLALMLSSVPGSINASITLLPLLLALGALRRGTGPRPMPRTTPDVSVP